MISADKILNIAEELDILPDNWTAYLNRQTGEVTSLSEEEASLVHEEADMESLPEWQREGVEKTREILEGDTWIPLPDKFDIHEWGIMYDFANSMSNVNLREELQSAIQQKGAFRRFKDLIGIRGIEEQWSRYKTVALERTVMDWLDANAIPYSRSNQSSSPES